MNIYFENHLDFENYLLENRSPMSKVVLGGGLSGLSATYYLLNRFPGSPVTLLEGSKRTGGWVNTTRDSDGTIFEAGPRTIRPRGDAASNTLQLVEDLGLENEIISIKSDHPAAMNRMIYVNGKLHKLPANFSSVFLKTPPFSKPLITALYKDYRTPKKMSPNNDESIYDFAHRRFGSEIADYIISPMICGICAGNSKEISVKFLMKALFEYEQVYGSVTRGIVMSMFNNNPLKVMQSRLFKKAVKESWSIYSFKSGMDILPTTLASHVTLKGAKIELNSTCKSIQFKNSQAVLYTNENTYKTDHLFSCIPANKLAELVKKDHAELSTLLKSIPAVDVVVLNMKFKGILIPEGGFGYLIPPKENVPLLGVIFDSCCIPQGNDTVITAMLGGYWLEKYFGKNPSEDKLLNIALQHIKITLNITDDPIKTKVHILRSCIPQYIVGHDDKIRQIDEYITKNDLPLSLCGASYSGVGVNDVILSAKNAVYKI